jgi:hypothetical protein
VEGAVLADGGASPDLRRGIIGFIGVASAAAVAVALVRVLWDATTVRSSEILWSLVPLVATLGTAFGIVALARYALGTPMPAPPATGQPAQDSVRDRLGPKIVAIGTLLIALLVVATIGAFLIVLHSRAGGGLAAKADSFLSGIFGAVLPVVATWVGTVLAFYFTRESFREAAQNTRELFERPAQRTVAELMIPYEKMAKVPSAKADGAATLEQARTAAKEQSLQEILDLFKPPVTRVPILDGKARVLFVVRQKLVSELKPEDTLAKYLDQAGVGADAISFKVLAGTASLQEARNLFDQGSKEIFVTENGREDQAVRGMLTDDDLRKFAVR